MMATHRERNTENGLFIKQRVKEKQSISVICCGKSYSVNKEECSEFLFYKCACFGCQSQEAMCYKYSNIYAFMYMFSTR